MAATTPSTSRDLIERAQFEADYINNEKDAYLNNEDSAASEANTTARTLSGQLILISGAILTFSSVMIGSQSTTAKLSHSWREKLIISWVLLLLSACAGILQVWIDYRFFRKWKKYNHSIAVELVSGKYISTNVNEAKAKFNKPNENSKSYAMAAQGLLLILGITIFLITVSHLLLSL
jgi:ABC-type Fe3+ transport system permease subunit